MKSSQFINILIGAAPGLAVFTIFSSICQCILFDFSYTSSVTSKQTTKEEMNHVKYKFF